MFRLWYFVGFILSISAAMSQTIAIYLVWTNRDRGHWLEKLYIVLDSVIIIVLLAWLCFGAYWRMSDQGIMCTSQFLQQQGDGMMLFYQAGVVILAMCAIWFFFGLCAGYWSYYASLPIRRFTRSSLFCCLCDS